MTRNKSLPRPVCRQAGGRQGFTPLHSSPINLQASSGNSQKNVTGFTLIELLVYIAIFAIIAGILTTIFYLVINSQKKQSISGEVTQQLNFVLGTVQRLVGESSLVEAVYEGTCTIPPCPPPPCTNFCTLRLRTASSTKDPTIIRSDAAGIYIKEGNNDEVALTNSKVIIDNLKFTKNEIPGGHAVVEINTSLTYNTANPRFAVTKAIESAIARVSAATFDSDLLPGLDNNSDIGQTGLRWKNGHFSQNLTVGGNVGIGTTNPGAKLETSAGALGTTAGNEVEIQRNNFTASNNEYLRIFGKRVANGTDWTTGDMYLQRRIDVTDQGFIKFTDYDVAFGSGASELMRIDNSGNVGIGTTTPGSKLHVAGQSRISGGSLARLTIEPEGGTTNLWNLDNQAGALRIFRENYSASGGGTGGAVRMAITDAGSVGIGTTGPTQTLHVAGTARITTGVAVTDDRTLCTIAATGEIEIKNGACGTSALRYKENIEGLGYGLNEINLLNPVFFNYKNFDEQDSGIRTKRRIGFIAEEVQQIVPEVVILDEQGLVDSIDYAYLTSLLAKGIQELDARTSGISAKELDQKIDAFTQGVARFVNLAVDRLTVGSSEKPTGITIFDKETRDSYCLEIVNGEVKSNKGACQ